MDGADAAVLIEVELEMRHLTLLDPSVFVTRYPSGNHGCGCAAARRANPVPRRSVRRRRARARRSEEHTSELQSLMRISYAVFCLKKKKPNNKTNYNSKHKIKLLFNP